MPCLKKDNYACYTQLSNLWLASHYSGDNCSSAFHPTGTLTYNRWWKWAKKL